ncbi:MAG: type II secretion system protein GspE, partial [Myxococcota bacterium]|nr:type II secretion system protein GspE [Myxococcota bacterium]
VCKECRERYSPLEPELLKLGIDPATVTPEHTVYRAVGCDACFDSGYAGRWGIHEMLRVDDEIRSLVMQNTASSLIKKKAMALGMKTLREDGAAKVLGGHTTIDEVMRVTAEDR